MALSKKAKTKLLFEHAEGRNLTRLTEYEQVGGYESLMQGGGIPPLYMWITATAWAGTALVVGFLYFISREREFAVRLV